MLVEVIIIDLWPNFEQAVRSAPSPSVDYSLTTRFSPTLMNHGDSVAQFWSVLLSTVSSSRLSTLTHTLPPPQPTTVAAVR
jgi:hypothetical protein